MLIKLLSLTA